MTENQQPYTPLVGQHINTLLQVILERILLGLHQAGFEDIRPAHLSIFRNLIPHEIHISELASRAGITKASVIYLVNDLEERGYVERIPDAHDGRATIVQFSDEMEAFLVTLASLASLSSSVDDAVPTSKPHPARLRGRRHTGL